MLMRELKITERIVNMLIEGRTYWPAPCKLMLLQCVANMAVSKENDVGYFYYYWGVSH